LLLFVLLVLVSSCQVVKSIAKRRLDWSSVGDYEQGQKITPPAQAPSVKPSSRKYDDVKPSSSPSSFPSSPKSEGSVQEKRQQQQPQQQQQKQHGSSTPPPRGGSVDPTRQKFLGNIDRLRDEHRQGPEDLYKGVALADALRMYDIQYHDGGTFQEEAIQTYRNIIQQSLDKRQQMQSNGEETNRALSGTVDVNEEIMMEYTARSIDGFLCALYSALGKTYFMANMFEKAVEAYSSCLQLEPYYLDAVSSRGSSRIILGSYEAAAKDFITVIERDHTRRFQDVFTGLARVLQAKEDAVPGGWELMIQKLDEMIPLLESQYKTMEHPEGKSVIANTLNRFYHVMFWYHDVKTKDIDAAWDSLWKSYEYKMSAIRPWNAGFELQKITATKQIFHRGFWPAGVGSQTKVPIFIIGFVRSGSTLLERVLDAHPQIVGTGENSVFNGQLDEIRNKIVEASMSGDSAKLATVISSLADGVVDEMRERWQMVSSGDNDNDNLTDELHVPNSGPGPERFVDKMLTNYYNVGFIHMLFPNVSDACYSYNGETVLLLLLLTLSFFRLSFFMSPESPWIPFSRLSSTNFHLVPWTTLRRFPVLLNFTTDTAI
jgi:tetratricopeptide (TPR) repeat protein